MSKLQKIYFTSDWHIGHANVIKFSQRPFTDCDHMHRVLVNNYNNTVSPEDTCYFLGDMGLTKSSTITDVISQLNGTKVLILGNHDKGAAAMKKMGFDVVLYSASIILCNKIVTMTHCPLRGVYREDVKDMRGSKEGENWHGETKNTRYSIPDFGQFHLHGHIHSPNGGKSVKALDRQYDVGVDANNYTPVSNSIIESWIARVKGQ